MDRKPYIKWGRFYNDNQDRIFRRIVNFIHIFYVSTKYRFLHRAALQNKKQISLTEWMVQPTIQQSSDAPIITWVGHATFLIQMGGLNILTDPVFFEVSRFFKRKVRSALSPEDLPKIDVILISHNHRDHLDVPSLSFLKKDNPRILVPFGNKHWLEKSGFTNVEEFSWGHDVCLPNGAVCTFLSAWHWTSRGIFDINKTLWGSWLIKHPEATIYFAGDSAYAGHFAAIAKVLGPIDIALMPVGPNEPRRLMDDAHMGIEEAIQAFRDLGARHFVPMHWGTFRAGLDHFTDLVDSLVSAWGKRPDERCECKLHVMKFGESKQFDAQKRTE